jgi:hypothetical protein
MFAPLGRDPPEYWEYQPAAHRVHERFELLGIANGEKLLHNAGDFTLRDVVICPAPVVSLSATRNPAQRATGSLCLCTSCDKAQTFSRRHRNDCSAGQLALVISPHAQNFLGRADLFRVHDPDCEPRFCSCRNPTQSATQSITAVPMML